MKNLPNVTLITIDCKYLPRSKAAADICQKDFNFGAVKILSSIPDTDPRVVPISPLLNGKIYSDFYIRELWKYVDTPFALTFHHDSFIVNPQAWEDEFLKYDYIGAPWYHPNAPKMVGGGGFAIRSKRLLDYVGKNWVKIGGNFEPEDLWMCKIARPTLEKQGMKFAPLDIASRFSIDGSERGVVWNGQFAWHGINNTDISKWFDVYPEYRNVFVQKLDDFTLFMRKYPVYDGTFHVFYTKPIQVENYKKLSSREKDYDCRLNLDMQYMDPAKPGHKMIYSLFRILLSKVGVPTFERVIKNIETFQSKKELLKKYPKIKITPSYHMPKWKQRLVKIFGNIAFPKNQSYTIFWFEK